MTIGEYAIVPALSRFIKTHPDMDFHIRYGNTQTLLTYLHEGTIDFAIVEGYFSVIITRHVSTKQKNTLLFPPSITHSKPVHNLRDLTSERLLIREHGSGTRAILTKTLALKNMSVKDFRHLVEIENIHTIVTLLKEDCGISFLYKSAVEQELNEGMLVQIPLSDFMIMHDFTFLWNKNSIFSQEYDAVFKELRGAVAK